MRIFGHPNKRVKKRCAELSGIELARATSPYRHAMVERLSKGGCRFEPVKSSSANLQGPMSDINITEVSKVSGPQCPISMEVEVSGQIQQGQGDFSFRMAFEIKDPEFEKLSDVTRFSFSGKIHADQNQGNVELEGTISSKTHGEVKITASGSADKLGNGSVEMNIRMNDVDAKLEAKIENQKITYFVQDREVSKEEFEALFKK